VVVAAGGAAGDMRAHAQDGMVGVCSREPEVDVAVELSEALFAGELRLGRAEQCGSADIAPSHAATT
jgi:hypothetical protein